MITISNGDDMYSIESSSLGSKVVDFKKLLAEISHFPPNEQRSTYKGTTLEDDQTLDSYGIEDHHTIHMEVPHNPMSDTDTDITTGDLGSPGLDCPAGGMPDTNLLLYPAISEMMRTLLSSPQLVNQIINQNPQLHDSIPQLSEMLLNPEVVSVVRRLTLPPVIQQMMSTPLLPENNQYPLGILPPGATAVPLEQLFAAQLSHLKETRDPDT